jgi:cytochrome c biogenesis protein CcdA
LAQRQIPPERKAIFYIGRGVSVIGILSFLSTFLSFAAHFGDFTNFEQRSRSMALRAVIGMVMMIAGGLLSGVGKQAWQAQESPSTPNRRDAMSNRGHAWPEGP